MATLSSNHQKLPEKPKTIEEKINDFCQDLEKGDFGLSKPIEHGYLFYGQTRSGKTAGSHLASGNVLKGVKIGGEEKVEVTTSKNKNAKIGNTPVSETRVPNMFEIKDPNNPEQKAYVIDTPGYGDTYGTFRMLQNGYYHYRLYSKVQNMKFILCFDQIQLQNTAELFIDTIVQFTSYFKDYKNNRHEIWKSCVFLINKVDETSVSLDDLKAKLNEIESSIKIQKKQEEIDLIKEFIREIVKSERLFTIKKYKPGESATRADLLKAIDLKTSWWSRKISEKNKEEVDMSPILFNITKPILIELTKNDLSKEEFIRLINYYNGRINEALEIYRENNKDSGSLDFVFNELVKDAMGPPDSHNFLEIMKRYVEKYSHIYDSNYQEQREKLSKNLFESNKLNPEVNESMSKKGTKIKDKNYIVKKFKFLENVEEMKNTVNKNPEEMNGEKSIIEKIDEMAEAVFEMIREFNKISYKRKNCSDIIYKYGYLIYRVISEVQVLLLLMSGSSDVNENEKQDKQFLVNKKLVDAADGAFLKLDRPLKDFMGLNYQYNSETDLTFSKLREKYIKKVDLNSEEFKNVPINWSLLELFSSTEVDDPEIVEKIIVLLEKFSEQFLSEKENKQENHNDTAKLIQQLTNAQINCAELCSLSENEDDKFKYYFILKRITENIGKLLWSLKKYQLAREVYGSIMYVDSVCRLFEEEIENLSLNKEKTKDSRTNESSPFNLKIQYGKYLKSYGQEKKAISVFQQAYELASNRNELEEIKSELSDALLETPNNEKSTYQQNVFESKFFENFDEDLVKQLEDLSPTTVPSSEIMM